MSANSMQQCGAGPMPTISINLMPFSGPIKRPLLNWSNYNLHKHINYHNKCLLIVGLCSFTLKGEDYFK